MPLALLASGGREVGLVDGEPGSGPYKEVGLEKSVAILGLVLILCGWSPGLPSLRREEPGSSLSV